MLRMVVSVDPLTESNCYIIGEGDRCVIIDPGESACLLKLLKKSGWTPERIFLTHEHCDHMAGLEVLRREYPGARFCATAACDAGIRSKRLNMSSIMDVYMYFRGKPDVRYEPFVCGKADEIICEDAVVHWRGHTLRFVPLPGHTPGSEGIFLDEKIFFCGDYMIPGENPIVRFPGGSSEDYERITEPFLRKLPRGIRICPGHKENYILE